MNFAIFAVSFRNIIVASVLAAVFCVAPVHAQIETIENGGITDKNTQKDNEDDEEVDLDKSKYKPSSLSASAREDGSVRLSWDDNAKDEDGYEVQRKAGSSSWQGVAVLDKSTESYTDRTAKRGTTYSYRVRGYNSSTETDYSSTATTTTVDPEPPSSEEVLSLDVVKEEIQGAVQEAELKSADAIGNLESELKKANEELLVSTQKLEATQACDISVIPEDQIAAEVESRCESFPGSEQIEAAAGKTSSLLSQLFHSGTARIVMSGLLLLAVLNNVWWHITHRSVRRERDHHREKHIHHKEQHHKYKALHEGEE